MPLEYACALGATGVENTTTTTKSHGFFFTPPLQTNFWGHIMEELWKSRVYDPFLPQRREGSVALDIGANVGLVSYYLSQNFEKVYSLEPSADHFNNLSQMLAFNEMQNVFPVKKALFIENGKFGFGGPKNNTTMRSLHMATWEEGKPEEEVDTITLEDLFKEFNIEHVNLMKLDVEGSEHEILSHPTFKNVANKIDVIVTERHGWSGRHPHQLDEALKNAGFNVEAVPNSADIVVAKKNEAKPLI